MIKQFFFFSITFLTLSNLAQGQSLHEQELVKAFEEKARQNARPIEYLQTDKDIYETGEQLWFKFSQLDGQFFSPYLEDSILYLRLMNQISREVFWEEKYAITAGFSDGMVLLNENLNPGIYNLEAYSPSAVYQEMKDYHAFKEIEIRQFVNPEIIIRHNLSDQNDYSDTLNLIVSDKQGNRLDNAKVLISFLDKEKRSLQQQTLYTNQEGRLDVLLVVADCQLLDLDISHGNKYVYDRIKIKNKNLSKGISLKPESGKLIHQQESWIMLSSENDLTENKAKQGALLKDGELLQFITIGNDGLGKFKVRPEKESVYEIVWNDADTDTVKVFQQIEDQGVTVSLDTQLDTLLMGIQTSWLGQKHLIRLQVRGKVYVYQELMLEKESQIKISLKSIPSGFAEIGVFSEEQSILAESLAWVDNGGKLMVEAELKQLEYKNRDKVTVTFTVKDSKGQVLEGVQLGGSVFDKLYQDQGYDRSLHTHGHIITQLGENSTLESAFHLSEEFDSRKINNILALSELEEYSWSRRNIEKKANTEKILANRLYGNISYRSKRKENDSDYALLFRGDNEGNTDFIPLDKEGDFEILPEELSYGNDEYLYIKALPKRSDEVMILSIKDPLDGISSILETVEFNYPSRDFSLKDQKLELPIFDRNMILLSEFVVRAKRFEDIREKFISELAERAKLDFNTDYVCNVGTTLNCPICGTTERKPVEGRRYMVLLDPQKSFSIDRRGYHNIFGKDNPFEHITYKYPKYTDEELMKLYNMTRTKGFFVGPGFLTKEYPDQESRNDPEADYRNTLVWNPYLFTDSEGKVEIEFYTSDIMSVFTGNFEALSADGKMGKVNFEFLVEGNN